LSLDAQGPDARSPDVHREDPAPAQSVPDTFFWP
jgi:hypothetical protein